MTTNPICDASSSTAFGALSEEMPNAFSDTVMDEPYAGEGGAASKPSENTRYPKAGRSTHAAKRGQNVVMLSEGRTCTDILLPSWAFRQVIGDSRRPGIYCRYALRGQGMVLKTKTRPPSAALVLTRFAIDSIAVIFAAVAVWQAMPSPSRASS